MQAKTNCGYTFCSEVYLERLLQRILCIPPRVRVLIAVIFPSRMVHPIPVSTLCQSNILNNILTLISPFQARSLPPKKS